MVGGSDLGLIALQTSLQAQALAQARYRAGEGLQRNGQRDSNDPVGGLSMIGQNGVGVTEFYSMDPPLVNSYQRTIPPLPHAHRTLTDASTSSVTSSSSSAHVTATSSSASAQRLRRPSTNHSTPPTSGPASPRVPVDFSFNGLESDLDRFRNDGDFASIATAAIASSGTSRSVHRIHTGFSLGNGGTDGGSPVSFNDILGDFATMPIRSPGPSNAPSPHDHITSAAATSTTSSANNSNKPSPSTDEHYSPASSSSANAIASSLFDTSLFGDTDEAADAMSRKDPIAAQAWRLITKAKNTLPNGARMENLTWRLMSMTLKKRREETAAAEVEAEAAAARAVAAAALEAKSKSEEEEEEVVAPLRGPILREEVVDRGRRGRTSASNSKSPESAENSPPPPEECVLSRLLNFLR